MKHSQKHTTHIHIMDRASSNDLHNNSWKVRKLTYIKYMKSEHVARLDQMGKLLFQMMLNKD